MGLKNFHAPNEEKLEEDIKAGLFNLENVDYKCDYGTCILIGVHKVQHGQKISVPGIVICGLCFTLPFILLEIPADHPETTIYNPP